MLGHQLAPVSLYGVQFGSCVHAPIRTAIGAADMHGAADPNNLGLSVLPKDMMTA